MRPGWGGNSFPSTDLGASWLTASSSASALSFLARLSQLRPKASPKPLLFSKGNRQDCTTFSREIWGSRWPWPLSAAVFAAGARVSTCGATSVVPALARCSVAAPDAVHRSSETIRRSSGSSPAFPRLPSASAPGHTPPTDASTSPANNSPETPNDLVPKQGLRLQRCLRRYDLIRTVKSIY